MLKPDLLEVLVCPKCKDRLIPDEHGTFLLCERCKLKYAIREDIPNMLIEEAVPY